MNGLSFCIEEKDFDKLPDFTNPKRSKSLTLLPMEIWFEIVKNFTTGDFEAFRKCNFEAYEIVACFQKAWRKKVIALYEVIGRHEFAVLKCAVKVNFRWNASSSNDLKRIPYSEFHSKIFSFQANELIQISRLFPGRKEKTFRILKNRELSAESYLKVDQLIQDLNLLAVYYKGKAEILSGALEKLSEYIKVDLSNTSTEEKISRVRTFMKTNDHERIFGGAWCLRLTNIGLTRVPLELFKIRLIPKFDCSGNYIWKLPVISKDAQEKLGLPNRVLSYCMLKFHRNFLFGFPASLNMMNPDFLPITGLTDKQVAYLRSKLIESRKFKKNRKGTRQIILVTSEEEEPQLVIHFA